MRHAVSTELCSAYTNEGIFKRPPSKSLYLYMLYKLTYVCIYFLFCCYMKYVNLL